MFFRFCYFGVVGILCFKVVVLFFLFLYFSVFFLRLWLYSVVDMFVFELFESKCRILV